jgi:hydroxymethylpyrimidine/phosphomethylpyrimidine kinase
LTEAAASAKKYIEQAIISGAEYEIGGGYGPVDHFFNIPR